MAGIRDEGKCGRGGLSSQATSLQTHFIFSHSVDVDVDGLLNTLASLSAHAQ